MNDDQFTPEEQMLIQRLRSGAAPEMKPEAVERLHQQILDEVDVVFKPAQSRPLLNPAARTVVILLVLGTILVIVIALLAAGAGEIAPAPTATPTPTPTLTATVAPTQTQTPTDAPTQTQTPTDAPTQTLTATPPPSPTPAPATTAEAGTDDPLAIVIEGPVTEIGAGYIVIFDVTITLAGSDPLVERLRPGDVVRVEGRSRLEGARLAVDAVRVIPAAVAPGTAPQPQSSGPQPPPPPPPDGSDRSSRSS